MSTSRRKKMAVEISIYNPKGGVGKTTIALNLAGAFAHHYPNKSIEVVDLDEQESSLMFQKIADKNDRELGFKVVKKSQGADIVIYDHFPSFDANNKPNLAPIVIMPTILDTLNYAPTMRVWNIIKHHHKALLLPNRVEPLVSPQSKHLEPFIEQKMPWIKKRVSLSQCFDRGDTIFGSSYFANQKIAQEEFTSLLSAISKIMASKD